jgi:hypothetical protein
MTSAVPKLVLAAALAVALPAVAKASPYDHRSEQARPAPARAVPAPMPVSWRHESFRQRELATLRLEFRALDREREIFHARFAGRPGKLRKYDRGYLARRTELERRWDELQYVAWR